MRRTPVVRAAVAVAAIVVIGVTSIAMRRGGDGLGDSALSQQASSAAVERCRSIARGGAEPPSAETIADCAALLQGNPLELQSLLNQAAAIEALSTAMPPTTASERAKVAGSVASRSLTGTSPSRPSTTTSAVSDERPTTSTTAPPPDPPCAMTVVILCIGT